MASRRQEKVARVIREATSDAIANHLSDPRITGFVSITHVDVAPDLRSAEVFLSILAPRENDRQKSFAGITHAQRRIQSFVAAALATKFCPVLHFHLDEHFQKTLETMRLIDQVAGEHPKEESQDP
jgi:ribosome-binding factor A